MGASTDNEFQLRFLLSLTCFHFVILFYQSKKGLYILCISYKYHFSQLILSCEQCLEEIEMNFSLQNISLQICLKIKTNQSVLIILLNKRSAWYYKIFLKYKSTKKYKKVQKKFKGNLQAKHFTLITNIYTHLFDCNLLPSNSIICSKC